MQGGLLEVITRTVEIECLPDEIPENFTIDVTELMIGQSQARQRRGADRLHEAGEPAGSRDRARRHAARRGRGRGHAAPKLKPPPLPPPPSPKSSRRARRKRKRRGRGKGQEEVIVRCCWWPVSGTRARSTRSRRITSGFMVVDRLAERHGIRVTRKDSRALVGVGEIDGRPVMLAKPQTFMNLSGTSLEPLMEKHGDRGGGADRGLRRAGPAVDGAADQAERFGRRAQGHGIGDRQPGNQRDSCGCDWGFTRATRSAMARNSCWRLQALAEKGIGRDWSTMRPTRSSP